MPSIDISEPENGEIQTYDCRTGQEIVVGPIPGLVASPPRPEVASQAWGRNALLRLRKPRQAPGQRVGAGRPQRVAQPRKLSPRSDTAFFAFFLAYYRPRTSQMVQGFGRLSKAQRERNKLAAEHSAVMPRARQHFVPCGKCSIRLHRRSRRHAKMHGKRYAPRISRYRRLAGTRSMRSAAVTGFTRSSRRDVSTRGQALVAILAQL